MTSCGSSPSTYGLNFLHASLYLDYGIVNSDSYVPAWAWITILLYMPLFFCERYSSEPFPMRRIKKGDKERVEYTDVSFKGIVIGIGFVLLMSVIIEWVTDSFTSWHWLCIYLIRTFLMAFYDRVVLLRKQEHDSVDHMAHLGGSLFGYSISFVLLNFINLKSNCSDLFILSNFASPEWTNPSCAGRLSLYLSLLYLTILLLNRK